MAVHQMICDSVVREWLLLNNYFNIIFNYLYLTSQVFRNIGNNVNSIDLHVHTVNLADLVCEDEESAPTDPTGTVLLVLITSPYIHSSMQWWYMNISVGEPK